MNADDDLSSLIFLGAPVRTLECFNNSSFNPDQGEFTVSTDVQDGLIVEIENFKTIASTPQQGVIVKHQPSGFNGRLAHYIKSFNDELSSYRFGFAAAAPPPS